ncbi:hypothetical protein B5M42_004725 [Paenibacillus athensensis]|uniref:HEAT repeat domain-containing protein n=1 Tax=Paenibacillus athensensis TaxID=1967502 RepID=A0A4Y8PST5_9BACL|nr:hypothetical protein [Paenibacillus athensensis]MCD1258142.1 hypothetical protein [Paenibacillus athensensis]
MDGSRENIVLFPKSVPYYEQQLTQLLQTERYAEALRLLDELLAYPNVDPDKAGQWQSLLIWLQTMCPEAVFPPLAPDEDDTEEALLRSYVAERSAADGAYSGKLLTLLEEGAPEQRSAALEQLAFVDDPAAAAGVRRWLEQGAHHPLLQLQALQTLKQLGATGYVRLRKPGGIADVDIEETPLTAEQVPVQIREMIRRVETISEAEQPDLSYFARQTWQEFLAFAYGTALYAELQTAEEGVVDVWASALHGALQTALFGRADRDELLELYGVTLEMEPLWEEAYETLCGFMALLLPETE